MTKMTHKKLLKDAPAENIFYLRDGRTLKNVQELVLALETMDENVFRHHVTQERNDFYNWIKDIFEDVELAERLKAAMDKNELKQIIQVRIEELSPAPKSKSTKSKKK